MRFVTDGLQKFDELFKSIEGRINQFLCVIDLNRPTCYIGSG